MVLYLSINQISFGFLSVLLALVSGFGALLQAPVITLLDSEWLSFAVTGGRRSLEGRSQNAWPRISMAFGLNPFVQQF
jgi:hypothetical protein